MAAPSKKRKNKRKVHSFRFFAKVKKVIKKKKKGHYKHLIYNQITNFR
jgi:ribosomal protein L32